MSILRISKKFTEGDVHLAAMEDIARHPDQLSGTMRSQINFALCKAYDDLGRHADAFRSMREANALKRTRIEYDEARVLTMFDRIRATFDARALAARPDKACGSSLPVFVIGMPRSGTTLIEQILASHPAVHGAGELTDLHQLIERLPMQGGRAFCYPDDAQSLSTRQLRELGEAYVAALRRYAPRAKRVTDKMPANFLYAGLIHLALPRARIIHVLRDPRDTCLSCYSKLFTAEQNFTYDLGELGRYYRKYAELMAHWRMVLPPGRMLEIRYEDVIADL